MSLLRFLSLLAILVFGAWALWPRDAKEGESGDGHATVARKYTIRFAPGIYMPGRRPHDVGEPLKALREVAAEFEKQFPDTHIEFTEAPVGSREYLVTQLAAEQAPEILNVNVEDCWQDVHKNWYAPLDAYLEAPNPFVPDAKTWWDQFKYQGISRGIAAPDGKMYAITLDMVETGIFYNKNVFEKLGLKPPKDWPEFLALQQKIRLAGWIPLVTHKDAFADWGMDLIFDQLYGAILPGIDLAKDPVREQYLDGYLDWDEIAFLNQKGFFTRRDPRYVETFRLMKQWRQHFQRDMSDSRQWRLFLTGKAAMWWDGSWAVNRLEGDKERGFDYGIFYLPPIPKSFNRFADGHDQVVIGGPAAQFEITNSAWNDTRNRETSTKLKRTVAFLQFLCIPKNTEKVVNEVLAFLPNIVGAEPRAELMPFHEILQRKYTTTKWVYTFDLRFNEIFRRMLDLYLNEGIGEAEFMDWMEKNNRTACETVVKRKRLDLSKYEPVWERLAGIRAGMKELPIED